ncbi:hypothetical protein CK203_103732 [Vitis vinifera]|uniref:Uncharacterized protein n=1 Tax=Vitis vinifera TaxID=29760 RepID=A0A438D4L1_VITVI|nr:hypothetical protein CK203_103732 [Vitis vinifera]
MQRDFLWSRYEEGKKDHLLNWGQVCGPKEFGGSGFGKISLSNHALLGKWLWRFPKEGYTLWDQVILSISGTHPNGWDANILVRWSHQHPWKKDLWWGINHCVHNFQDFIESSQLETSPFWMFVAMPPLSWNLIFRRNLIDLEIKDLEGLLTSLTRVHLSISIPDAQAWA